MSLAGAVALSVVLCAGTAAKAEPPGNPKAVKSVDGKYYDQEGDPTYNVAPTARSISTPSPAIAAITPHTSATPQAKAGPAPALKDFLKRLNYQEFAGIVIGGRENKQAGNDSVMPSFAENKNAMCYLDDLYIYLRARC